MLRFSSFASLVGRVASGVSGSLVALGLATLVAGCPKTEFYDEGAGQPTDRALGKAPAGAIGACRVPKSIRPPIVSEALWQGLEDCNRRSPRRYLRLGYGEDEKKREADQRRIEEVLKSVEEAESGEDANTRMLKVIREVQRIASVDDRLRRRVAKSTSRTFTCDYAYLFKTQSEAYKKVSQAPDACTAYVFDSESRGASCLFDMSVSQARWLTSAWSCLAFTETVGEGMSCYRLCDYDDYCAAQVGCSQADFDLLMCALGVCIPEGVAGFY